MTENDLAEKLREMREEGGRGNLDVMTRLFGVIFAREIGGPKVILPVWHNISAERIRSFSPMLADRLATRSSDGLRRVVDDLVAAAPTS